MQSINWDNIPETLTTLPHWVMWRYQKVKNHRTGEEKQTKVPFRADLRGKAASNNPDTWADFDTAKRALEIGDFDGVGFMLGDGKNESIGLVGVDLDHCFNPETGEIAEWAHRIVDTLGTYTEITPSGEGLRCFGFGSLPPKGRKKGDFECYSELRFLTVTGRVLDEGKVEVLDVTEPLAQVHKVIFPPEEERPFVPPPTGTASLDDQTLLDKMFASKNGDKWRTLYQGDFKGAGYSSQSEGDSALCFTLAFWWRRDALAIDRVFRTSGLMRDKWDERHGSDGRTYGQLTVDGAVNKTSNVYEPNQSRKIILRGRAARRYALGEDAAKSAESNEDKDGADEDERVLNNGLYAVENGRTVLRIIKTMGRGTEKQEVEEYSPVVDLSATITQEFRDETGKAIFGIEGRTVNGRKIKIEIPASKMTDPKAVSEALSNIADASCVFYAGKEKHLGPAIKSFSVFNEVESWRRFNRTGWTMDGNEFIIPGLEAEDISIALPKKLAFHVLAPDVEQLRRGHSALKALLEAQRIESTCVALAHFLAAPMALHCDWHGERSALFLTGRTGSFKSAWATLGMCIYGPDFANEDHILKFGPGATNNSRMKFLTGAADMPLLIDNYKPGAGKGEAELVELIHTALEGGEKERLERTSEHRESAFIHAWPVFTGEDTVHDAAAAARCLIVPFPLAPDDASHITLAQQLAPDLHFIGGAIISWLMSNEGRECGKAIKKEFDYFRSQWAKKLRAARPDMVNIYRVASNLAVNECAWRYALSCPALAPVLTAYSEKHASGLEEIGKSMGQHTAQSVEANRYMEAIRALLSSDQAYLCQRIDDPKPDERRAKIGWEDDDGVYLIPEVAFSMAVKLLRDSGALNNVSKATVHKQMAQLGYLEKQGKDEVPVGIRVGMASKKTKVVFLKREVIYGGTENDD